MERSVEAHLADVLSGIAPLPPFELGLLDARGCRLADDVIAPFALPAFSSATCEGYAVRVADCAQASDTRPVQLLVVDAVVPGSRPRLAVVPGAAVRVRLGSALPEGAEAVIPADEVVLGDDVITVRQAIRQGAHIRRAGVELARDSVVLERGTRIDARRISLLAAAGVGRVRAHPRPRVVIVTIGDELVEPGAAMLPGTVSDSNGVMLSALVQQLGAVAYRVGPIADDADVLEQVLADQLVRADLVVIAGGVAATSYETVVEVANRLGSMEIHRVSMMPGAAQGLGQLGDDRIPTLTLPGYPAAAFVSFEVFVRPVIMRMAGADDVVPNSVRAELLTGIRSGSGRRQYVPSLRVFGADGVLRVQPLHSEHVTAELAHADCLLVIPEMVEQILAGDIVDIYVLDGAG
ncbi:MAG: molybdopterin molybdotransferase MoeA [Candidatus Nanopelagicales bacterium]